MLFTSPSFILFLLVTFSRYCLPCFRLLQVLILVLSIFLFYGFGTPALLPLLLTSMPLNSAISFRIAIASPGKKRA